MSVKRKTAKRGGTFTERTALMRFKFCLTSVFALATALPASAEMVFNRVASFPTPSNMAAGEDLARELS